MLQENVFCQNILFCQNKFSRDKIYSSLAEKSISAGSKVLRVSDVYCCECAASGRWVECCECCECCECELCIVASMLRVAVVYCCECAANVSLCRVLQVLQVSSLKSASDEDKYGMKIYPQTSECGKEHVTARVNNIGWEWLAPCIDRFFEIDRFFCEKSPICVHVLVPFQSASGEDE